MAICDVPHEPIPLFELARTEAAYKYLNHRLWKTKIKQDLPNTVAKDVLYKMLDILENIESTFSEKRGFLRCVQLSPEIVQKLEEKNAYYIHHSYSMKYNVMFHSWTGRRLKRDIDYIYSLIRHSLTDEYNTGNVAREKQLRSQHNVIVLRRWAIQRDMRKVHEHYRFLKDYLSSIRKDRIDSGLLYSNHKEKIALGLQCLCAFCVSAKNKATKK
jgi:hypothetical protein